MFTGSSAARCGRARAITDINASPNPDPTRADANPSDETTGRGPRWRRILWFFLLWLIGVGLSGVVAYALKYMLWLVEPR